MVRDCSSDEKTKLIRPSSGGENGSSGCQSLIQIQSQLWPPDEFFSVKQALPWFFIPHTKQGVKFVYCVQFVHGFFSLRLLLLFLSNIIYFSQHSIIYSIPCIDKFPRDAILQL